MKIRPELLLCSLLSALPLSTLASSYEAFTEPEQDIAVAAPEAGIIAKILVKEGEKVKQSQVLATLDNRVLEERLKIAQAKAKSYGEVNSAKARQRLRQDILSRLQPLLSQGAAQQTEVAQARAEVEVARADVQSARENVNIYALEVDFIKAQIESRTLRSPIDGVVTDILKDPAEIVVPSDAHVLSVAQVSPLKVTIHVPTPEAVALQTEQAVQVKFPHFESLNTQGKIVFISPVTDAGSDTVEVVIRVDNQQNQLRSGLKCLVEITS